MAYLLTQRCRAVLTGCGGRLVSSADHKSGILTSPLYPKSYPAVERSCQFAFEAQTDERVQVEFSDFQLHYSAGDPLDPHEYAARCIPRNF